jgi:hypothetical protein
MEKVDRFFGCDFRVGWGIVVGEGFCVRFADAKHLVLAQILWPSAAFGHKSFVGAARVRDEWRVEGLPIAVRFFAAAGFVSLLAGYSITGSAKAATLASSVVSSASAGATKQIQLDAAAASELAPIWLSGEVQGYRALRRGDHEAAGNGVVTVKPARM